MLNLLMNTFKIDETLVIFISIIILLIIIALVVFIIYKDKKQDEEIEDIMDDMENDVKVSENTIKIEGILDQMQKDLEARPEEVVSNFEKEQEEKAIISYQELVKQLKKGTPEEHVIKVSEDTFDGDKTLSDLVEELKNPKEELKEDLSDTKKFRNTDFISPIYGKLEDKLEYPRVKSFKKDSDIDASSRTLDEYLEEFKTEPNANTLEQTLDMEPISNEIKQNEEFLKALKEFRENL